MTENSIVNIKMSRLNLSNNGIISAQSDSDSESSVSHSDTEVTSNANRTTNSLSFWSLFGVDDSEYDSFVVETIILTSEDESDVEGLTSDRIKKFTTFKANQKTVDEGCAICINGVEINKLMIRLDCNHVYCSECISKWFENKVTCPE